MKRLNFPPAANAFPALLIALASSVMMTCTIAQAAEEPTLKLRSALSLVPESVMTTADPMPVVFLDIGALSKASDGALSAKALGRMRFVQQIRPLEALTTDGGKSWTDKAGVPFDEISYFTSFGSNETNITYWGLANAVGATKLLDTLKQKKFDAVSASPLILANGKPGAINLANRDPNNPWSGLMGRTSAVMALDSVVAQASAPELLTELNKSKTSVETNKAVAVALSGLDSSISETNSHIIQAGVFTPLMGVPAADPAFLLDAKKSFAELSADLEKQITPGETGLSVYAGGIVADLDTGGSSTLAVSLAYGSCEDAEKALSALQSRWEEGMATPASVTVKKVYAAQDGCAAVAHFTTNAGEPDAFTEVLTNYLQRGFNVLQIGLAP